MADTIELIFKRLSAPDRKLLQMSIRMNAIFVANADGNYSFREQAAVGESVRQLMSDPAYRPLIALAGHGPMSDASLRVLLDEYASDADRYLANVSRLIDLLPEDVQRSYRAFTAYAIVHVAEASRDGLFGLVGKKISVTEMSLIRKMVSVLGLEPTEEQRAKLEL